MLEKDFIELYASQLNEQQMEAVRTVEGPVLLLAVPGSGKTTVLVNRLGYMIYCKGIAPENILTLTYTVAATRDMANRFEKIFGPGLSDRIEFRTINGICSKIIAYYGNMIGKKSFELLTDEKEIIGLLSNIYLNVEREYPTESDINFVKIDREQQYIYLARMAENVNTKTAVLYRDNESVLPLVDMLERKSIPYSIKNVDMAFFTNRVVMDIINMLQFAFVPMDAELFMKIYFKFQLYLSKKDAMEMCELAERNHSDILDAIELLNLNGHVLGNCKSLRTHYRNMVDETPYKAINRIENFMGYGDYLNDNNIDTNKIFILKMLAKKEKDIPAFLNRLTELRRILMEKKNDSSSKFILSTIHSSKGLEYDSVILMDVINGVFPNKVVRNAAKATPQENRDYEEERRIFYVGMTRAKEKLTIFKYENRKSTFINELKPQTKKAEIEEKKSYSATMASSYLKRMDSQRSFKYNLNQV